jgi:uncharacterized protein (TIRG00374 family)
MAITSPPTIHPSFAKLTVLAGLLGFVSLVLYFLYFVGISGLISVIGKADVGVYILAIAIVMLSITFDALVWFQLLKTLSIRISFRRTYVLNWVGTFVDTLIPGGWAGDIFKAYLLNKDPRVQSGKAVASIVAKNVYEAIISLGSIVLSIILLFLNYTLESSVLFTLGGVMMLLTLPLVILLIASFKLSASKKIVAALFRFISRVGRNRLKLGVLEAKVEKALVDYHEGMKTLLQNPKEVFRPLIFSFLAWLCVVISLLFVFASLGQLIPIDKVIIVRSIVVNVEAQGYVLLGYAQIITSEIYRVLGVPFVIGASVALLGGVVIFLIKTVISYIAFYFTIFSSRTNFIGKISASNYQRKLENT